MKKKIKIGDKVKIKSNGVITVVTEIIKCVFSKKITTQYIVYSNHRLYNASELKLIKRKRNLLIGDYVRILKTGIITTVASIEKIKQKRGSRIISYKIYRLNDGNNYTYSEKHLESV